MLRLAGAVLAVALAVATAGASAHEGRIVGGKRDNWHAYPYFANIDDGLCSGALIAPDRVMTAAHCLDNLVIGATVLLDNGAETRRVIHLAQHPKLTKATKGAVEFKPHPYDAAVLGLDAPVTTIAPLRLATVSDAPAYPADTVVTTMGTGSSSYSGDGDGPFRTAQVQIRSDEDCTAMIRKEHRLDLWVPAAMLCTTDPDNTKPWASACYGDSGSPLVGTAADGQLLEVGMDSWGAKCGEDKGGPEQYTDVALVSEFALDPAIVWRPEYAGGMQLRGKGRVGRKLSCTPPRFADPQPDTVERGLAYSDDDGLYGFYYVRGKTLRLTSEYRGHRVVCYSYAKTTGGPVVNFSKRSVVVRAK